MISTPIILEKMGLKTVLRIYSLIDVFLNGFYEINNLFCILVQHFVLVVVVFLSRNALFSLSLDGKNLGKHS